jgi:hypothetical protein
MQKERREANRRKARNMDDFLAKMEVSSSEVPTLSEEESESTGDGDGDVGVDGVVTSAVMIPCSLLIPNFLLPPQFLNS